MIRKILEKVKANKKYKTIADSVVEKEIEKYLKSNQIEINKRNINQISKQDIKNIRANLHKIYSSFQTKKKKKFENYLEDLDINKLLSITISTKERINEYPKLYKQIFKITGNPKTIIDLGSGLNPLSYPLMNLKGVSYFAYDIDTKDIDFLNKYFKKIKNKGINGKAAILDIRDLNKLKKIPKSDIIFLFKVIDVIDKTEKNHKLSEEIIKTIIKKTKHVVASFATRTITRKKMNFPSRKWFELMLKRNNLHFQTIKTDNEIYYVVKK